jgi:hypothetical protein
MGPVVFYEPNQKLALDVHLAPGVHTHAALVQTVGWVVGWLKREMFIEKYYGQEPTRKQV